MSVAKDILTSTKATLKRAGIVDVFLTAPSALVCPQPIVLAYIGFGPTAREENGDTRASVAIGITCCREREGDAVEAAFECRRILQEAEWEFPWHLRDTRIVACHPNAPTIAERDNSGRYTCGFTCDFTVIWESVR